ncbi:MAG: hypothetical protein QOE29_1639, partial [Gaiellaceae bacterium]|nr:hypothetical protein [Gaiellaceae bacterium]
MPEISVVIPTHNRRERLRACLASLAAQTAEPSSFEVVVAVDGSADGTEDMLRTLETPFALRVVVQPQSGQSAAINAAVAAATAPSILILDDDMIAAPELIAAHQRVQREQGGVAGIGLIQRRLPERIDSFARYRARQWRAHYERLAARGARARDCYGGNVSLPRATFVTVGGFATDFPVEKDTEFALRLAQEGLAFTYVPEAVATEDQREDWREICRDAEERGFQTVELYRRHPEILAESRLGGHEAVGAREAVLRRLLLALRVPPAALALVARGLPEKTADRWFDFTYGLGYWRGVRRAAGRDLWLRLRRGTLVLAYHAVGAAGEEPSRYVVPERRLAAQLRWLARRGYRVLALEEYLRCRRASELPPPKSVVLTFDDGYRDNATLLAPLLERAGA